VSDAARIRLTSGTRRPVPSGPFTPLVWDAADNAKNWPQALLLPCSEIVLPYTGYAALEVFDVDFWDDERDPSVGPAGRVGDRLVSMWSDRDPYSTRASDQRPAASARTVAPFARFMPVQAGQVIELRVKQTSGITLFMGAVEAWIRYDEIIP
jgi:hypothetical protein